MKKRQATKNLCSSDSPWGRWFHTSHYIFLLQLDNGLNALFFLYEQLFHRGHISLDFHRSEIQVIISLMKSSYYFYQALHILVEHKATYKLYMYMWLISFKLCGIFFTTRYIWEICLSLYYGDSIGVNKGKRLSLCSKREYCWAY